MEANRTNAAVQGENMNENDYPKTIEEKMRASDKLFLEYAIKKCALTLSREEILSQAERLLREISDEEVEEILIEYGDRKPDTAMAAPVMTEPASDEDGVSGRSRDAPEAVTEASEQAVLEKRQKKKKSMVGDLLFYGVLAALIVGAVLLTGDGAQGPRTFAGFTAQTVLTSSMESVYPKGALVVSHRTDPNALEIGDDITFMASETTTITHRIIGIVENYADTGQRAFQTQGVMNQAPDSQLVPAVNVVGKVVFHSHAAGKAVDFLKGTWPLLLFFLVLLAVLVRVLQYIYRKDSGEPGAAGKQKKPRVKRANPLGRWLPLKAKP